MDWLVLDVSNLCYRAFHTTGDLSYGGEMTGVLYGVFRDITNLQDLFGTHRVVFCFDGGYDQRLSIYPGYKSSRRETKGELTEMERVSRRELRRQIHRLRTQYLPDIGFRNVFWQDGYEADDLIARVCELADKDNPMIIVSSDHDLFQCISPHVSMWLPSTKSAVNLRSFHGEWGLRPSQWSAVKAIAGCSSDSVPGVVGVGDKTAAKYLRGDLKPTTKAYQNIEAGRNISMRNLKLTKLPMEGTMRVPLADDEVTKVKWAKIMESLGMTSLSGRNL